MRASVRVVWAVSSAILWIACDAESGEQDAGRDAAPPSIDAGPPDSGATDAGPPTPADTAEVVETEVVAAIAQRDAIPSELRTEGAFLEANLVLAGAEAIIGEKGLGTLSLSAATVRALADLRQANVILRLLERAIAGLARRTEPQVIAYRMQLERVRDALADHRDALARTYLQRLAAGIPGTPIVREAFISATVYGTDVPARILMVASGRSDVTPSSELSVDCMVAPVPAAQVRVFDEATGEELGSASDPDGLVQLTVPTPFDETRAIAIEIEGAGRTEESYGQCYASLGTRQLLREPPIDFTAVPLTYFEARSSYFEQQAQVAMDTFTLRGRGIVTDSALVSVDAWATILNDTVALLLPVESDALPVENVERIRRELQYVRAMTAELVSSAHLADPMADGLRLSIAAMMDAADAMVGALTAG
jgi:hypothetical protein